MINHIYIYVYIYTYIYIYNSWVMIVNMEKTIQDSEGISPRYLAEIILNSKSSLTWKWRHFLPRNHPLTNHHSEVIGVKRYSYAWKIHGQIPHLGEFTVFAGEIPVFWVRSPDFFRGTGAPCTEPNARLARRVPVAGAGGAGAPGTGTTPILRRSCRRVDVSVDWRWLEGNSGEWVCLKIVYPEKPNGFHKIIPTKRL